MGSVSVVTQRFFIARYFNSFAGCGFGLWPGDGGVQFALQYFGVRIEASDLAHPFGVRLVSGFGDESDELRIFDEDAVALREMLDGGVDVAHGGDAEVGNVHADLGAAVR